MTEGQARRLAGIMAHAFTARDRGWTSDEIRALAAQSGVLTAACPAGFGMVRVAEDEAEILTLAVLPDRQGKGIGRALLRHLMELAHDAGARRLLLEVGETNAAARRLYDAEGFGEAGRRPGYLRLADGQVEDALILSRGLP